MLDHAVLQRLYSYTNDNDVEWFGFDGGGGEGQHHLYIGMKKTIIDWK